MKKYLIISLLLTFAMYLVNCNDDDETPDPLVEKAELIVGTWSIADNGVDAPADASTLNWSTLSITISGDEAGGTIAASGVPECAETIWPASEAWVFSDTQGNTMTRGDDVVMTIDNATESSLTLSFPIVYEPPTIENGFLEAFDYDDGTVYDDVTYDVYVEWPESSSVQDGVLSWDMDVDGEGSFGAEFEESLDLTDNSNLKFKYIFPADAFVDIYVIDADGLEGELGVTFVGGTEDLQDITLDLSGAEGYDGGDPPDVSKFAGFYIIFYTPTASTLSLDDVTLGEVAACSSVSLTGDWTFRFDK
jgi:hypothetical protein